MGWGEVEGVENLTSVPIIGVGNVGGSVLPVFRTTGRVVFHTGKSFAECWLFC